MNTASAAPSSVDSATAHELLKEATKLASASELEEIGRRLETKARVFDEVLGTSERVSVAADEDLRRVVDLIFSVRARRKLVFGPSAPDDLRGSIHALVWGEAPLAARFDAFAERYAVLGPRRSYAFASELLHFTRPRKYWLWTHWIWDPATGNGALKLLTDGPLDLGAERSGETYVLVGRATAMVASDGAEGGYTHLGRGLFGTDVFLACTASIALYTQYRLRISQEFLRFVPELAELSRRLLGVQTLGEN